MVPGEHQVKEARYYVQSESVRGEGRTHWICNRENNHRAVTEGSARPAVVKRHCDKLNQGVCARHPGYKALKEPTADCPYCQELWQNRNAKPRISPDTRPVR